MPQRVRQQPDPYALLADRGKTTLSCPGGRVLGYGPGPGLAQCIAWNGIGSLFSAYRPSVAVLSVFESARQGRATGPARDPGSGDTPAAEPPGGPAASPAPAELLSAVWHPNHAHAEYRGGGLRIGEDRYAVGDGLVCRLALRLDARVRTPREYVLCFHGQAEQWPFFDYPAIDVGAHGVRPACSQANSAGARRAPLQQPAPLIHCAIDPSAGTVALRQPHPHPGLPLDGDGQPPCTVQTVTASLPFAACGFALSEAELRTLWHDHGPLASLRLRLGQVGARFGVGAHGVRPLDQTTAGTGARRAPLRQDETVEFSHRAPLYYFSLRLGLEPGEEREVVVESAFAVEPGQANCGGGDPPPSINARRPVAAATALEENRRSWQRYLSDEVPQLECSDPALTKYWYYVWHILRANRCSPGAHIRHSWTAPSKYMYWGPWIWDGYFHVLGEMWLADAQVAFDSIRAVLDMQFPNGFLPVCSGADYRMCFHDKVNGYTPPAGFGGYASYVPSELAGYHEGGHPFEAVVLPERVSSDAQFGDGRTTGGDEDARLKTRAPGEFTHNEKTQTPLITLAAADLLRLRGGELPGDMQAAALELLGPLWAYEQWLWHRRTDRHGRFILWHGDESGWDNATRHYPVPALPYDVQVHCLLHREALRVVMLMAGETAQLAELDRRIGLTRSALDSYWHAGDKWHYDLDLPVGAHGVRPRDTAEAETGARRAPLPDGNVYYRKQVAASGLFGLLADSRPHVVDSALHALSHPRAFASEFPIPTLATCDPDYAPHGWGWNGPVWLQVNYFVLKGLLDAARRGRRDALQAAWKLWEQTKALVIRDGEPYSHELYDPQTGTGMGCPDYSWQAMLLNLIIAEFAGVPVGDVGTRLAASARPDETLSHEAALKRGHAGKSVDTAGRTGQALSQQEIVLSPCLPPSLNHLRIANLPGAVRAIELQRTADSLRIAATLSQARRIALRDSGLGGCSDVRLEDGTACERDDEGEWRVPSGPARKTWVIIAACR